MRGVFIRLGWLELKLPPLMPRVLISSLICAIVISIGTNLVSIAVRADDRDPLDFLDIIINVFAVLILILFWNSIYFTFHFFQKSRNQELNNISLEASKNEIELKNLRSQLNPHFLFNSLNSIRALIDIEPQHAKGAVTTLSNLLRKSLILGKEDLVPLSEEMEMVSNYLELEKVRFEERLTIEWELDEKLNDFLIPPFSLQMLVENAIKHGISNLIEGGVISIESQKHEDRIVISVRNSGTLKLESDTGIGIANTTRRLALQYGDHAEFILQQVNECVVAQLIFKIKDN
jgi:LytS/YehU family sensor histidine kinase